MNLIDCFFIGHNDLEMSRQRQLLRLAHGENSHYYNETNMSNRGIIKYKNKLYSTSKLFNELNKDNRIVDSSFNPLSIHETFNLAIAYLGTYLHKRGMTIDYINSFNSEKEKLAEKLKQGAVRAVAIPSSFYIMTYPVVDIINFVRKYSRDVKIIVGGTYIANQVRTLDESALKKFFTSMGADIYIYSNEGEFALSRVVKAIRDGLPLDDIDNIYYKDKDTYVFTKLSIEQNLIDENAVDWGLFEDGLGRFVNIRTSVSCPFSCSFCNFPRYAGKYRLAGLEAVENEIKLINSIPKVTGMWIIDDTYNFPPERFKDVLRVMIRNNNKVLWQAHIRAQYLDREMVELMKQSGCRHVILGIESGSPEILRNMNKKAQVEKYREGIALLNEYGIMNTALLIVGFPGETMETHKETCNFIEETKPTFYQARLWWCDQDTPIYKENEKFKLEGSGFDWCHETMNADTAMNLIYDMLFDIKNSIFESDFPIPFHLACRGISEDKIKAFLQAFNECIKEKLKNGKEEETSEEMIEKMRKIFIR
jgi:anaerobic magnesium-protoporphyrin IX monomethyl ester cyclase